MDRDRFEELVVRAVNELPEEFLDQLHNLDIVVEDRPSYSQRRKTRTGSGYDLLGLYEGVPRTRRGRGYGMVLPDKITIFQGPIEARCRSEDEIKDEVRRVVRHEIAHHFGANEEKARKAARHKT